MTGLFGDNTHSSSPRSTAADSSVSRSSRFAHETTSADPSVSKSHCLAHETTLADLFVSRTRRFAHETDSEDPTVSRTRRSAHENDSEDTPMSRTRRLTHETTSEDTRRQPRSCRELRGLYGDSTGTLRTFLDAAEVRPEPVRLIERLGAFRDCDLDG